MGRNLLTAVLSIAFLSKLLVLGIMHGVSLLYSVRAIDFGGCQVYAQQ